MECWCLSKRKPWLYWLLMIHTHMVVWKIQGDCIEEERKALLEIKDSFIKLYNSKMDNFLPTWVDYGGDCCEWERVNCNATTGHVTDLSFYYLRGMIGDNMEFGSKLWPLNVSLFLHFKELTSLNLSYDYLDEEIMKTELERLSSLKKLEVLDLSGNRDIDNDILPSLKTLTSLKVLDLSHTSLNGNFPTNELSHLTNLEELELKNTELNETPNIQACKSLSRLKRLERIDLSGNKFNKSIISCLTALPSLKILHLSNSPSLGSSFPVQEFHDLFDLEVLLLRFNGFRGFASFHRLEVLDLSHNSFVGSIPLSIQALSSLRALSFANNELNGSLPEHGFCELNNLHELDLSHNMLDGILPQCFNSLSSLRLLDISSNRFTGKRVPSFIANLTSLEYIDFSHNNFEGSFSFSSFSNHKKLEVVRFRSDNDIFEVETEEPIDWIPMFQLKILELSNCNMKMPKGRIIPGFLLHQHNLRQVDMSHNSLEGQLPNWLIRNNSNLEVLILRDNLFGGMPLHMNANMKWLDMSQNHMIGTIPYDIPKFFPNISILNLSMNALSGVIPSSVGELSKLCVLDLSENALSGEVPKGLFTDTSKLGFLKLSNNKLHGQILSGNLSWSTLQWVYLDSNHFTGQIGIKSKQKFESLTLLDISNNFFTGLIPDWLTNMSSLSELVVRNNSLEGRFPCGAAFFSFLDISQNSFSGPIPSCSNLQYMEHLHLGSNRFTGSIPNFFRNLTNVLTLDIGNNNLSGRIPKFLGELSNLRILLLRKNNFSGLIPRQLCQLSNMSFIDLSANSFSGSIPSCLHNITGPSDLVFLKRSKSLYSYDSSYHYESITWGLRSIFLGGEALGIQDEVQYTTKSLFLRYKGGILDYMTGLDLSSNKLTGEIPEEVGFLTQLRALNLSHNQLTGLIPVSFSNLAKIESLDLSSNGLTGTIPSELIKLTSLSIFNVSHNSLSGRLPEMKSQFGTFTEESYEGNPLLCGPPLEKKCTTNPQVTNPSAEEDHEKWYDIDMTYFYGSSSSTCFVFLLGFVAILYTNPRWRRRWLDWVEDCIYTCYYFLYDLVWKPSMIFCR
ncbi:receptor like protein 21 [Lactuca sativa]|uniref:receptor like protein 21 n=1 Tax=Lactuca sativa TaxID=4236 RepID=UPI0022AEEA73|nr:receptor like protein 21 [Lactuca sativa]